MDVGGGLMFPNRTTYLEMDGFNYIHIHGGNRYDSYFTSTETEFIDTRDNNHNIYANFGLDGLKYETKGRDGTITSTIADEGIKYETTTLDGTITTTITDEGITHSDINGDVGIYADTSTNQGVNTTYSQTVTYRTGDMILYDGEWLACRTDFVDGKIFDYVDWKLVGNSDLTGVSHDNLTDHQTFSIENRSGISTFRTNVDFALNETVKTITFLKPYDSPPTMYSRFDKTATIHQHNTAHQAGKPPHQHLDITDVQNVVVGRYLITTTATTVTINRVNPNDRPVHNFDLFITGWVTT